ncbi:MAG: metal ABC transporter ATP-binding protein [Desulfocapsaceae bacterium]|nr:metal ABC transporter ATP-binding protein [Desulfocapsaceae bacterium]
MHPISLCNLTLGYERHPAVHHLSGVFKAGSMTAVVGPNGSGKSTLLKGITGSLRPLGGHIDRGALKTSQIAYLPQQMEIDRSFPITVLDVVILGLWRDIGMFGGMKKGLWHKTEEALQTVGLAGFESRPISDLSGGQFRRVMFARMLLQESPVVVLDEPFTSIDNQTTLDLFEVIKRWHAENRTIIAVLHDFSQVRSYFPQTLLLARELVGWGETRQILTDANLQRSRRMSEAWDESAAVCQEDDQS